LSDWSLPPLSVGEFAPDFSAPTRSNPKFYFSTLAGRYVLLGFLPDDPNRCAAPLAMFDQVRQHFDDVRLTAFLVTSGAPETSGRQDQTPGQRWFFDPSGHVRTLFGTDDTAPAWFLFDPTLRLLASTPLDSFSSLADTISTLPSPGLHAGAPLVAPVAILPRIFEPEFCRQLIDHYEAEGGQLSGVMRDVGGRTVGVMDDMKRRRDVQVTDPALRQQVARRLERRLIPMVRRAFQFNATRLERYLVACYDADEGGYFKPHRDNETFATAHRRFAVSINLNAEDFTGGDLRFPEFGPRTYRPHTGGALVFCCSLQHEATPVTAGRRFAFLPFLYDEAGQAIRDQNQALLDNRPPQQA
jgi:predicted 2-oxoglutarate/Fe(II)-dependent dioxygenase YbiX